MDKAGSSETLRYNFQMGTGLKEGFLMDRLLQYLLERLLFRHMEELISMIPIRLFLLMKWGANTFLPET